MFKMQLLPILVLATCLHLGSPRDFHADAGLNIIEFATKYGYPIESHEVQTEDGYLLTLHRIPHGINSTEATRGPILLMHGMLSSSMDWINMGPELGFGLLLADQGYDVWMGNARGTTWSRKHVTLDPDVDIDAFWDFDWHEIGYYDLPAMIDHILEMTGEEKVFYVGHSQGTTSGFVLASSRPEYNEKIKLMVAFAPVAYMSHVPAPILQTLVHKDYDKVLQLIQHLNIHEFLPHFDFLQELGGGLCSDPKLGKVCVGFLNLLCGPSQRMDPGFFEVLVSNAPAGISVNQLIHYAQEIKDGYFRQYDFGAEKNLEKYGQETPPAYDTTKITAPVSLYYAANDYLAAVEDVEKLAGEVANLVNLKKIENFNHVDFLWALDVVEALFNDVIAELNSY